MLRYVEYLYFLSISEMLNLYVHIKVMDNLATTSKKFFTVQSFGFK